MQGRLSLLRRLRTIVIGAAYSPHDKAIFHKLSLIAFFAWVGLGADGLSSSCYGPSEAFAALQGRIYLAVFVAMGSAITVFIISASYSQIIELFPSGGGGYLVASKLLSPVFGMISGCALLVDYVLTITLSIASGADAIFSFLPPAWYPMRLWFAGGGLVILIMLNLRGVKESVLPLVPIFLIFVITHAFAILYAVIANLFALPSVASHTVAEVQRAGAELGVAGTLLLLIRSYSMGAGTYTGIEAVSNGLPILREPRVQTGKHTMRYMAVSLSFMVLGLMFAYVLYRVPMESGKTLNAVLFEHITGGWGKGGAYAFMLVTLVSEAAILFVAAQTGFLDGPRVMANMALDRWIPTRFAMLSDRFVTQNGILLMGGAAIVLMLLTRGSVRFLIVLYSINVFITFSLSQLGMVRHWWGARSSFAGWRGKILTNGVGLVMCLAILISVILVKFNEGGWITLLVTGTLVTMVTLVRRRYADAARLVQKLDGLVAAAASSMEVAPGVTPDQGAAEKPDPQARTAVVLVKGFGGTGLHTLLSVFRMFGDTFRNFLFVEVGVIDAGTFKGTAELERLTAKVNSDLDQYVQYVRRHGYYAEGVPCIGHDVVDAVAGLAPNIMDRFPQAIFFSGRLVFPKDSMVSRWMHNYIVFAMQKRFNYEGIPFFMVPIRM